MDTLLIKVAQLILSLSILIVLHELGHFLPARWFKVRVEKFYLFFDPWFSLFKKKVGDTEYGIGWLPLGGYVKIAGMVDESMDRNQMAAPPKPDEFRSKPAWQRLIIMVGGVTVNLILGFALYSMIMFVWGNEYLPVENVRYGVHVDSLLEAQGMRDGDMILAVGEEKPKTLSDATKMIMIGGESQITIRRNGRDTVLTLAPGTDRQLVAAQRVPFALRIPTVVDSVIAGMPAEGVLQKGDEIVAVNGTEARYFEDFRSELSKYKGQEVQLDLVRNGTPTTVAAQVSDLGTLGFGIADPSQFFEFEREEYTLLQSIPAGISHGWNTLKSYVSSLKLIFTREGAGQIGGFGTLGSLFPASWNWQVFWELTAFLSIVLAFMNILPIPALDGGHVVFLLYEMVSGRTPNQKVLEYAQLVGMVLVLALVLYANGNDLFRFLK